MNLSKAHCRRSLDAPAMVRGRGRAKSGPSLQELTRDALARIPPPRRYLVAYSGGPDSLALLEILSRLARGPDAPVLAAVHVNHRLAVEAQQWVAVCREVCRRLAVGLTVVEVDARPRRGEGPEAAARSARYAALGRGLCPGDLLLLAHHQEDQAETLLSQLLRGAGPAGLAGMPAWAPLGPGALARPWLEVPRERVRAHARGIALPWVEDPSNRDPRLDRGHLREAVWPALLGHWPAAARSLAAAARRQAETAGLLAVLAELDLEAAAGPRPGTLSVSALLDLAPARRRNALAGWLRGLGLPSPGARRLVEIAGPMLRARADRQPRITWPGGELRRHRGLLHAGVPGVAAPDPALSVGWPRPGPLWLPHGRLLVEPGPDGMDPQIWARGPVRVGLRQGGERCRPAGAPHHRSLKKLLQERGLPPWERAGLPLVFVGGELAAVGDLWVCEGFQSPPGRRGWRLRWMPSCALAPPSTEGGADDGAGDPGGSPTPGCDR